MKLYKFSDGADLMWIEDAEGKAHQIASISYALEGVDVAEIENAQEWALDYAKGWSVTQNEMAADEAAEVEELESQNAALDEDEDEEIILELKREMWSKQANAHEAMDEDDINEMARHIAMLIEYRKREDAE